jgi:hypothetical protein
LLDGIGLARDRRNSADRRVGDAARFWRVAVFGPNHLRRLSAKMKLPIRAWLACEVTAVQDYSTIWQTAIFDPEALSGLVYLYALQPFTV